MKDNKICKQVPDFTHHFSLSELRTLPNFFFRYNLLARELDILLSLTSPL